LTYSAGFFLERQLYASILFVVEGSKALERRGSWFAQVINEEFYAELRWICRSVEMYENVTLRGNFLLINFTLSGRLQGNQLGLVLRVG